LKSNATEIYEFRSDKSSTRNKSSSKANNLQSSHQQLLSGI